LDENSRLQRGGCGGFAKAAAKGAKAAAKTASAGAEIYNTVSHIQDGEEGIDEASFALGWCSKE
jgi:hypothetical protein